MRKAAIILIVIALLSILAYRGTGTRFRGEATNVNDIPIVGHDLSELVLTAPASYSGFEHPHGGGTITLSGTATNESIADFCRYAAINMSLDGTAILDRNAILDQLRNFHAIETDASVHDATYVLFGMNGRFPKLYGTYDAAVQRFVIWLQFDDSQLIKRPHDAKR